MYLRANHALRRLTGRLLDATVDNLLQLMRLHHSTLAPLHITVLKEDQGGYALNLIRCRDHWILVNIHFDNSHAISNPGFKLFEDRSHHFAGTTPLGGEINQGGFPALDYF